MQDVIRVNRSRACRGELHRCTSPDIMPPYKISVPKGSLLTSLSHLTHSHDINEWLGTVGIRTHVVDVE